MKEHDSSNLVNRPGAAGQVDQPDQNCGADSPANTDAVDHLWALDPLPESIPATLAQARPHGTALIERLTRRHGQ